MTHFRVLIYLSASEVEELETLLDEHRKGEIHLHQPLPELVNVMLTWKEPTNENLEG